MNQLEFFKELYFYELKKKENVSSSLNLPTTLLVVLMGAMSFLIRSHIQYFEGINTISIIFSLLVIITTVFFIKVFYFLFKALIGYDYKYLPRSRDIRNLFDYWTKFNRDDEKEESKSIEDDLIDLYTEIIDNNMKNNLRRIAFRYKTFKNMLYAVIAIISASVPFLIEYYKFLHNQ